jgi:ParB-like nuclease domain
MGVFAPGSGLVEREEGKKSLKTVEVEVGALEVCDRTRVRNVKPNIDSDLVEEYAEAYRCGLIVEPLDVFQERGTQRFVVADGENRLLALQRAKVKTIKVRLHDGDEVAALDFAIGCNHAHGLRRTKADKYHAFVRIMETPLKDKYRTDTDLSEKIGVAKRTIADYKVQWRNSDSGGDRTAQRKKQKAREDAGKNTRADFEPRKALNGRTQHIEAPPSSKLADDGWTKADETSHEAILDYLADFAKFVGKQTRPAVIQARDTVVKTVRELFA